MHPGLRHSTMNEIARLGGSTDALSNLLIHRGSALNNQRISGVDQDGARAGLERIMRRMHQFFRPALDKLSGPGSGQPSGLHLEYGTINQGSASMWNG